MADDLQFEKAEFTAPQPMTCSSCNVPLSTEYYAANDRVLCASCAVSARQFIAGSGLGAGRFLQAVLLGVGAAVLGAAVYAGIMIAAKMEIGLISIAVGWFVGKAVRKGSHGRGGWRYQVLAAFLTYAAICGAYGAMVWHGIEEKSAGVAVWLALNSFRLPFLGGFQNVIGLLIIAFGVWQAWQMNRQLEVEITGPHAIGTGPRSASA
ncbi:MAG: hypothetical protein JWQ44_1299 [Chthoniobacter sp.]|jgi:hypothetical protein|nr:hypothetical protein [Chthoniobacter sp.]